MSSSVNSDLSTFFLVVTPGLEAQAERELIRLLAGVRGANENQVQPTLVRVHGGIEFQALDREVADIQSQFGVVTRILKRLAVFEARRFDVLTKKLRRIPFADMFDLSEGFRVKAASSGSRLRIKKAIEKYAMQIIGDAAEKKYGQRKSEKPADANRDREITFLVRVLDDVVTVSVDLSQPGGLYKRGVRTLIGKAPLRETYARAAVQMMLDLLKHLAGSEQPAQSPGVGLSSRDIVWVEPMAGSAVFTLELLALLKDQAQPWPKEFKLRGIKIFERDEKMLRISEEAVRTVLQSDDFKATRFPNKGLSVECQRTWPTAAASDQKRVHIVMVNPPWGIRLKPKAGELSAATLKDQRQLLDVLDKTFFPSAIVAVLPKIRGRFLDRKAIPNGFEVCSSLDIRVGGIPVRMFGLIHRDGMSPG